MQFARPSETDLVRLEYNDNSKEAIDSLDEALDHPYKKETETTQEKQDRDDGT